MLKQLMDLYTEYETKLEAVREKASVTDGLFGMGDDPRNHPCHMAFYEGVADWVARFQESSQDPGAVCQAVRLILAEPAKHRDTPVFWFMFAAQGHCRPLIGLLDSRDCQELVRQYDGLYSRRERMPVQKEVYKLLKKAGSPG